MSDFFFLAAVPYCTVLCKGKNDMLDLWATVVMSDWMNCGILVCSHCVSLQVERIEDQFCIFRARFLPREHRPVPLPVAGWSHLVTI